MLPTRWKSARKKGRAEAEVRKGLAENSLEGTVHLRALGDAMSATVLLKRPLDPGPTAALEKALAERSGLARVVLVSSDHGETGEASARKESQPAPGSSAQNPSPTKARRAPARGGHADPLAIGSRPQERPSPKRPEGVRLVLAVASGKGGVGKSTIAAGLALALSRKGHKVGLLDLDIHGPSLPVLFPHEGKLRAEEGKVIPAEAAGLKLVSLGYMVDERTAVAWRGPMVMNAARQLIEDVAWGGLDILIVDTPPGTGDTHLSMVQRLKLDGAVLVVTPSPLAAADVRRGAELFRKTGTNVLGMVLNMTGPALGETLSPALTEELGLEILASLPLDPAHAAVPLGPQGGVPLEPLAARIEQELALAG